jgi:predicted ATPase
MSNIYLAEIVNLHEPSPSDDYPFNIPAIKSLRSLSFTTDVTYFIGENGSGKSTLLEAIAIKMGMNAEGGGRNFNFSTNATHSNLEEELKCVRTPYRLYDNFFYRAESFYNAVTYLESLKDGGNPFFAYGGESLHHCSHGEGMVRLIENRLECGFYIFDEPEAALSYQNQLRFLLWMHRAVKAGSQLIVSTHSPVLLAYPGAAIYHLNAEGITKTTFEDSYIYNDMRSFVNNVFLVQKELGLWD